MKVVKSFTMVNTPSDRYVRQIHVSIVIPSSYVWLPRKEFESITRSHSVVVFSCKTLNSIRVSTSDVGPSIALRRIRFGLSL